jgi:adenylate cyclase
MSTLTEHAISVLLVDDQPMIGDAIRRMLESEKDIQFHYCADPTTALAMATTVRPTVILQDLVMPQIEGLQLVRFFRANPSTRDIPLIVLSAREEARTKSDAFALGANDYMVKLPDKLELIARIRYHSRGYISMLERNEAFEALVESQRQLELRNRFIRETFGRYLSDSVVNSLLENPGGLALGGEDRIVTVMMSDLRGFTALTEDLPAVKVVELLNRYLEAMTDVIVRYEGTIDEFIGDAILVIFGAPITRDDDAARAIACALEMQLAMEEVNRRNRVDGLPQLEMGIGLNTGEVVVGNIGSLKRAKYGVVGTPVNLAARVESYTIGGQVLISGTTRDQLGELVHIGGEFEVEAKGLREPLKIFEVVGIGGIYEVHLPATELGLEPLGSPLLVRFSLVEGKFASPQLHSGAILQASMRHCLIESAQAVRPMQNVRINIVGEESAGAIYGKVMQRKEQKDGEFLLRFTSIGDEARKLLRQLALKS